MIYVTGLLLFLVGINIGLDLPDTDLRVGFLVHRSILTHGFIIPLGLAWLVRKKPLTLFRLFALGVALSLAVHLSFDLFPRGWTGFALIHIPLLGRTSPLFSQVWLALSVLLSIYLAIQLIKTILEFGLGAISLVGSFGLYATTEAGFFGFPLLALLVACYLAVRLSSSPVRILQDYQRTGSVWQLPPE